MRRVSELVDLPRWPDESQRCQPGKVSVRQASHLATAMMLGWLGIPRKKATLSTTLPGWSFSTVSFRIPKSGIEVKPFRLPYVARKQEPPEGTLGETTLSRRLAVTPSDDQILSMAMPVVRPATFQRGSRITPIVCSHHRYS